ncbi:MULTISPECIES: YdeI/OmpD-associated family protein [Flavobacterium]|nr:MULTISPECIES: YdeI/OmpD-associated family protein [Flavobacterium]
MEYIETAKQEKTKLSRLEKIKPMIMKNIGLNDKYK